MPRAPRNRARIAATGALASTLLACLASGCPDDRSSAVPPRAERRTVAPTQTQPTLRGADTFLPEVGTALPVGTRERVVAGATVGFGGFELRGLLELDADRDGDRDLVVALVSPNELAVGLARRDGVRFVQSILSRTMLPKECSATAADVRTLGPDLGAVRHELRCTDGRARVLYAPFVLGAIVTGPEVVTVAAPAADDPTLARLTVAIRGEDVDRDGSTDVVFDVDATGRGSEDAFVSSLVLRNLASGMSADAARLEREIARLEPLARRELERSPARAGVRAIGALALARAVCPEGERPASVVVGHGSLRCTLGATLAKAEFVAIAAAIRTDALALAEARLADADARGIAIDEAANRMLTRALGASRRIERPTFVPRVPTDASVPSADPPRADADVEGVPARRFGDLLWFRLGEQSRIVALPHGPDAGAVGACTVDPRALVVACRSGESFVDASIGAAR